MGYHLFLWYKTKLQQGASEAEISMEAFGWDYVPIIWLKGNTKSLTGIAPQVLEDTPEITLSIDRMGRHTKLIKNSATIPLPPLIIRFPLPRIVSSLNIGMPSTKAV